MKLRTTGSPAKYRAHCGSTDDFIHDALAAHALLQAIGEQCNDCAAVLKERADELMREWGFE